jgi:hypothetical protein
MPKSFERVGFYELKHKIMIDEGGKLSLHIDNDNSGFSDVFVGHSGNGGAPGVKFKTNPNSGHPNGDVITGKWTRPGELDNTTLTDL